jgi:DNA helicase-2/ATP-dependent DNA helicase PcrA
MSVSFFSKLYKTLNPGQKKAVDTIDGPVIVIAGPGTGKTTILTLRIANILQKTDTAPENILALTFTESGAYVMRRKLLEIIGTSAYKVNIHTFHGFAEKIIQEYPDYFPRIIGSKIITDAEQIKIVEQLVQSRDIEILRPYGDPSYYVRSILSEIHTLKRENISPKELSKNIKNAEQEEGELSKTEAEKINKRNEKNKELALVYGRYEEKLAEQKFYDFDDMLIELIRAMEKEPIFKLILQENYHYILADEHQDANASQNRILELLADFHDSPNLFIVGDDKQAIYKFQGASLDNFLYFKDKYKDANVIELEHNYRSQQNILDASHSLILQNPTIPGRTRTKLISLQVGTAPIYFYEFSNQNDELEYLASLISDHIKKGDKPEDLAILYRTNSEADMVAATLKAFNIPYRIESDYNILNEIEPTKLVLIARAVNDISNSENLAKVLLLREMDCDPASVSELFSYSSRERLPLFRVIGDLVKLNKKDSNINNLIKILDKAEISKIIGAYNKINSWTREAQILSFPALLQKIIKETNIIASVVAGDDSLDRLSSLEAFFDKVIQVSKSKKTFHLSDFIEYVDIVSNHGLMSKKGYVDHVPGIRLMTAHKSKGLEFDRVFIVSFVN